MALDQIAARLGSEFASWLGALCVLLFVLLLIRSRGSRFRNTWRPLIALVRGRVKKQRTQTTMTGSYHGHAVTASLSNGADAPSVFAVQMPVGSGGRDWEILRRSEKLLGPETWRPYTKDPALQQRLDAANVAGWLRAWPPQAVVRYDAAQGILLLQDGGQAPSGEHFKAQLDLLDALAEVNGRVNSD